jgi:hypothetical protein
MVMRKGMLLTLIGTAIGLAGAFALTRWMSSMLFGVAASDPLLMWLCCSFHLARLCLRVRCRRGELRGDPLVALRYDPLVSHLVTV